MRIVIEIDENAYTKLFDNGLERYPYPYDALAWAARHGVVLPNGHGDLVTREFISDYVHSHIQEINTEYGDLNAHTNRILRMIEEFVDNMPTVIPAVIPADKEEQEG